MIINTRNVLTSTKLDDLAEPDDNTDLNSSSSRHGLLPKLSNTSTEFLNGQGAWATPAGASAVGVPIGGSVYHKGALPANFLACDGSAISRTTYAALFAVIGEEYGIGDGSTTFNLPDDDVIFASSAIIRYQ